MIRGRVAKDLEENSCLAFPPLLTLHTIPVEHNDVQTSSKYIKCLRDKGVEVANINGDVDLLLGRNAALAMEPLQVVNSQNEPCAVQTRFGWIIRGTGKTKSANVTSMRMSLSSELDEVNNEVDVTKGKLETEEKWPFIEDEM